MGSIGSILSIANSGLRSSQQALEVAAHNIANANTEGYSRQQAVLTTGTSLITSEGVFGSGVRVANVTQIRNALMDRTYHRQTSLATEQETREDLLAQIEGILGEPSDTGLASGLDTFFSSFSELAANPTNSTARALILADAQRLASSLRDMSSSLSHTRETTELRLSSAVSRINAITDAVATLNQAIVSAESGGLTAGDLRDRRNSLVDELSSLVPIQVTQRQNGSIGVLVSGASIVDSALSRPLEVKVSGPTVGVGLASSAKMISGLTGMVGGLLGVLNTDLPAVGADLDALASELVTAVNTVHQTGTNPNGTTGLDFFDPAGLTANSIAVAITDPSDVSAGVGSGLGEYQGGSNDVALSLAGLRDTTIGALGGTLSEHLTSIVSGVGQALRFSRDAVTVHSTLVQQADIRRMAVSGVSLDEELVRMIQFQTAYAAAARVITTVDEMLQTLVNI